MGFYIGWNSVSDRMASYSEVFAKGRRLPHFFSHKKVLFICRSTIRFLRTHFHSFYTFWLYFILPWSLAIQYFQENFFDIVLHKLLQCDIWKFCSYESCKSNCDDFLLFVCYFVHNLCIQWDVGICLLFICVEQAWI